jgi:hypothetical protein
VGHYKGKVDHWEVMNEPNWEFVPEEYLELLKVTYEAAKRANPACVIVGPSSTSDFGINAMGFVEKLLQMGGGKYLDVISVHLYLGYNNRLSPEAYALPTSARIEQLEKIAAKYAPGKPIWSTEMCWYHADEFNSPKKFGKVTYGAHKLTKGLTPSLTAGYLLQNQVVHLAHNTAKYFDFTTEAMSRWTTFSTDDSKFAPNAILPMYCNMSRMLDKVKFIGRIEYGEKIRCYAFEKPGTGQAVAVIWTIDESIGKCSLSVPGLTAYDMMGNPIGAAEFEISNSPVYIAETGLSSAAFLGALNKISILGMRSLEVRGILSNEGAQPCWTVIVKSLFSKDISGVVKVTKTPPGLTLSNGRTPVEFGPLSSAKPITSVRIPVAVSGSVEGKIITWVKAAEDLKAIDEKLKILVAEKAAKNIKIDGVITPEEWDAANAIAIDQSKQAVGGNNAFPWSGRDDLSAKVSARWDENNLYLLAKVLDDSPRIRPEDPALFKAASIEIFIDTDELKDPFETNYTDSCCQLICAPAIAGHPARVMVVPSGRGKKIRPDDIRLATQRTAHGYDMEVAIPAKAPALDKLFSGEVIRFNIGVNDAALLKGDVRRKTQMIWNAKKQAHKNKQQMDYLLCE